MRLKVFSCVLLSLGDSFVESKRHSLQASSDYVSYFGRFDFSADHPTADWSGSRISMLVEATSSTSLVNLSVAAGGLVSSFEYFVGVYVNCEFKGKYQVTPSVLSLDVSFPTTAGEVYEVSIVKLTEASTGAMSFRDVAVTNGNVVPFGSSRSCHSRDIKMFVIGDSITCGYGVEGEYPCTWSASTENIRDSYASLVADSVGAEVHTIAWSGKGVVRNYGDVNPTSSNPMPMYYNRTLGISSDPSLYWDPNSFVPDVVLVTLGSNDYSTTPHPSDSDFITGYTNLLTQLRTDFPNAKIAAVCEPKPGGNECENVKYSADTSGATYIRIPDDIYVDPQGCDYHPSIQGQKNIAAVVTPIVQEMLIA